MQNLAKFNRQGLVAAGFTLIEMAIVMTIAGLMLASTLALVRVFLIKEELSVTDQRMQELRNALSEYILDDPASSADPVRYPCPASLTAGPAQFGYHAEVCPPDTDGDGTYTAEVASGAIASGMELDANGDGAGDGVWVLQGSAGELVLVGAIPAYEIEISGDFANDSYGNRFVYAISLDLVEDNALAGGSPSGAIRIVNDTGALVTNRAEFVVLSPGKDKAGSFLSSGTASAAVCRASGGGTMGGDAMNCAWQFTNNAVFRQQNAFMHGNNNRYYDDTVNFSLAQDNNNGWWRATTAAGRDIININPEDIYMAMDPAGRVGIGTNNPQVKLQINGDARIRDNTFMALDGGDRVGIGNLNPQAKLHVTGDVRVTEGVAMALSAGSRLGIGNDNPQTKLHITGDARITEGTSMALTTGSRVGIGTNNPQTKLHVTGDARITDNTFIGLETNSRAGIGTGNPQAKLDVRGEVKIGNSGLGCSATTLGSMRYNVEGDRMEYCSQAGWQSLMAWVPIPMGGGYFDVYCEYRAWISFNDTYAGVTPSNQMVYMQAVTERNLIPVAHNSIIAYIPHNDKNHWYKVNYGDPAGVIHPTIYVSSIQKRC